MKFPAYFILASLYLPHAQATSNIVLEARNTLQTHGPLRPGDVLLFPRNFTLTFSPEQGMATTVATGRTKDGSSTYACALAIEAKTEVRFPEPTRWHVIAAGFSADLQRVVLAHEQFGLSRVIEVRCTGLADMNAVLVSKGIKLLTDIPVEEIDDQVPRKIEP
jgi:hypothetical protein